MWRNQDDVCEDREAEVLANVTTTIPSWAEGWSEYKPEPSINQNVAYWRKANQIHKWFVDNVQDGNDDCGTYEVSKEKLQLLLSICIIVKEKSELIPGTVRNGYRIGKDGKDEPILEKGKVIKDPKTAKELLPATRGFFFGSTDYNE